MYAIGILICINLNFFLEIFCDNRIDDGNQMVVARRYEFNFDPNEVSDIIGAPSLPSHLPQALPILPGHTLIRPAMGMLKSSVKFPHRELEDGSGVYGNINNLGIKYIGRNERVLYTGFRRSGDELQENVEDDEIDQNDFTTNDLLVPAGRRTLRDYIMVIPENQKRKPSFTLTNMVLDLENERQRVRDNILKRLHRLNKPLRTPKQLLIFILDKKKKSPLFSLTDLVDEDRSKNIIRRAIQKSKSIGKKRTKRNEAHKKPRLKFATNDELEEKVAEKKQKIKKLKHHEDVGKNDNHEGDLEEDFIEDEANTSSDAEEIIDVHPDRSEEIRPTTEKSFIERQKEMNILSISDNAFDFDEFLFKAKEDYYNALKKDARDYWFYNQVDYKPFDVDTDVWVN